MARPAGEVRRATVPALARERRGGAGGGPRYLPPLLLAGLCLALLTGWWALPALSALPGPSGTPARDGTASQALGQPIARPTARPTARPGPAFGGRTAEPAPPAVAPASPRPSPRSAASRVPTLATPRPAGSAPDNAQDFDRRAQVVPMGFPLKRSTDYRYRDNWGDLRAGDAEHYNHAHSRREGDVRRAHDGIDLYAKRGEPVLSPFDGIVIDPATRWQPWHRARYGRTAVVLSREPTSEGYVALLTHLDRLWVQPGQVVRRGEVLGTVGSTGNAEGGRAHLHFELRAPFAIGWRQLGEERLVDAFNPFPSLIAADPKRSD